MMMDSVGDWKKVFDEEAIPCGPILEGRHYETPKKCIFSFYVADIIKIDTMEQSFVPRIQVMLDWEDDGILLEGHDGAFIFKEDVCGETQTSIAPELAFNPKLGFVNDIEDAEPLESSLSVAILRGRPVITQYYNFQPVLRSHMDLREFPFDEQVLSSQFYSTYFDTTQVQFILEGKPRVDKCVAEVVHSNSEWNFVSLDVSSEDHSYPYLARYDDADAKYQHMNVNIRVQRNPWYYILRVVLVSSMLNFIETCSFLMDTTDLGGRFSVSGTMFLSAVAFYFVTLEQLPKVGYLTRADIWNIMNFILMFGSTIENALVFMALSYYDEATVQRFDRMAGAVYALLSLGCTAWFISPVVQFQSRMHNRQQAMRNAMVVNKFATDFNSNKKRN